MLSPVSVANVDFFWLLDGGHVVVVVRHDVVVVDAVVDVVDAVVFLTTPMGGCSCYMGGRLPSGHLAWWLSLLLLLLLLLFLLLLLLFLLWSFLGGW